MVSKLRYKYFYFRPGLADAILNFPFPLHGTTSGVAPLNSWCQTNIGIRWNFVSKSHRNWDMLWAFRVWISIYITGLTAAILKFLPPLTLNNNHNIAMEFLDPENVGVTVGISFLGVTESEIPCCMLFMYWNIFVTGFAAAILDFRVGQELRKMCHSVVQSYLGKVTKAFPLTPSGSEMAAKISVWG